jgi:hypothetical protein
MPLRIFTCDYCNNVKRTLGKDSYFECDHGVDASDENFEPPSAMREVLAAPTAKMMEVIDKETGKSRLKDQMKILKERTRNYARDREADDLIQANRNNGIERSGFLNKDGKKRTKLDDL